MHSKWIKRTFRLLLGIFAPPVLGSILFLIYVIYTDLKNYPDDFGHVLDSLSELHIIIFFSFFFVGIQAILYSLTMEFIVRPRVRNRMYFVLFSSLLGAASGFVPGVTDGSLDLLLPIGIIVGAAVGLLLYSKQLEPDREMR